MLWQLQLYLERSRNALAAALAAAALLERMAGHTLVTPFILNIDPGTKEAMFSFG